MKYLAVLLWLISLANETHGIALVFCFPHKSSLFICIMLFTIYAVSKQLYWKFCLKGSWNPKTHFLRDSSYSIHNGRVHPKIILL